MCQKVSLKMGIKCVTSLNVGEGNDTGIICMYYNMQEGNGWPFSMYLNQRIWEIE